MRVKDLEKKMSDKEHSHRDQMKKIRNKMQSKLKIDKIGYEKQMKMLKIQLNQTKLLAQRNSGDGDVRMVSKLENEIQKLRTKEKDLLNRLNRITFSFKKVDMQREKNMSQLKEQLEVKSREVHRMEKVWF